MRRFFLAILFCVTAYGAPPRDVYPVGEVIYYKGPEQNSALVPQGSDDGQLLYWEATTGLWTTTDANYVVYDDGLQFPQLDPNYITVANDSNSLVNSILYQDGTLIGQNTITPIGMYHIYDTASAETEMLTLQSDVASQNSKNIVWRDAAGVNVGQIDVKYDGTKTDMFFGHLFNSGPRATDLMTLTGDGRLGIGTTTPGRKLQVNQSADSIGFGVYGYDDKSSDYLLNHIDSSGNAVSRSSGNYNIVSDSSYIYLHSDTHVYADLGDAAGAHEFKVRDSGAAEVATIDSDGNGYFAGNVGIGTTSPDTKLQVVGDTKFGDDNTNYVTTDATGDMVFVGGAGLCFADMYAADASDTITISVTGKANKVQITSFTANGVSNNCTPDHTNDHITITKAGMYLCNVSIHAISTGGGGADNYGYSVYKNNGATEFVNLHGQRDLTGGGGDEGSMTLSGIIDLAAADTIEVWIWNNTNADDIVIDDINLSLVQVGGT